MGISAYNTTPASNTAVNGINIAEGCNASNVNDAIRQIMADLATHLAANGSDFPTPATFRTNLGLGALALLNVGTALSSASGNLNLANTAVTPGSYTLTALTVDAQGRITSASNGSIPNTAVTPGAYTSANITVGADGRITSAASGGVASATGAQMLSAALTNVYASPGTINSSPFTSNGYIAWHGGTTPAIDSSAGFISAAVTRNSAGNFTVGITPNNGFVHMRALGTGYHTGTSRVCMGASVADVSAFTTFTFSIRDSAGNLQDPDYFVLELIGSA